MKKLILTLALCGVLAPLAIIGCGGGGGGLLSPNPTATPTANQPVALAPTTFTLQNGQRVTLSGTRTGDKLAGKLTVLAPVALPRLATGAQNASFPFSVGVGEYGYTGTFTPPRGFNIVGNFGALGSFTMTGQLQTATEDGSYSITTNGVTDTGILPASGTPAPGVTNTPTPPTSGFKVTGNLTVSATTGGKVIASPFNTFAYTAKAGEFIKSSATPGQSVSFGASTENLSGNGVRRDIGIGVISAAGNLQSTVPFTVGQRFDLTKIVPTLAGVQYSQVTVNGTSIQFTIWRSLNTQGGLVVKAVGTDSITLELVDVRMRGLTTQGTVDTSAGEFTLNGTLTATGLTVKNN